MKKTIISIVVLTIILGIAYFTFKTDLEDVPEDVSELTNSQIISLLETSKGVSEYMEGNKDFRIKEKTLLTEEVREESRFKSSYQNLDLEGERYLKIRLTSEGTEREMIAVLDLEGKTVMEFFSFFLMPVGVD